MFDEGDAYYSSLFFPAGFTLLAPVAEEMDNPIHWINHYPVDNAIDFQMLIRWIVI